MTPILLKPKGETMRFSKQHKRKQLQEIGLSQGDVQQLLHLLRVYLDATQQAKDYHKYEASESWLYSSPDTQQGRDFFEEFSMYNKAFIKDKKKEKNLVNLIKKLKGLQ